MKNQLEEKEKTIRKLEMEEVGFVVRRLHTSSRNLSKVVPSPEKVGEV